MTNEKARERVNAARESMPNESGKVYGKQIEYHADILDWFGKHADTIQTALRIMEACLEEDWQPIESAPRDQTKFLALFDDGTILVCLYLTENFITPSAFSSVHLKPTHWKPLTSKVDDILKEFRGE